MRRWWRRVGLVLVTGLLMGICAWSCGGSGGVAGYGAIAYTDAMLVVDPTGATTPKSRYDVSAGDRLVLVFEQSKSGSLLAYDTDQEWVVAVELPADAVDRGTIDIGSADVRAFGRVASGEVMYLSHHAVGEVRLEAQGEEEVGGEIDITFEQQDEDLLEQGPLKLEGEFSATLFTP